MNAIFNVVLVIGILLITIISPENVLNTLISASEKSVTLCISLISIYAVWLGLLKILEDSNFNKIIARWLNPIIKFLFGNVDDATKEQIAINLSSNILGMGNASTPSGIRAMQGLDNKTGKISDAMTMLMVINCLSLQLLPTTIIGLRIAAGSKNPTSIILATILTSLITGFIVIFICKLYFKIKNKKRREKKI